MYLSFQVVRWLAGMWPLLCCPTLSPDHMASSLCSVPITSSPSCSPHLSTVIHCLGCSERNPSSSQTIPYEHYQETYLTSIFKYKIDKWYEFHIFSYSMFILLCDAHLLNASWYLWSKLRMCSVYMFKYVFVPKNFNYIQFYINVLHCFYIFCTGIISLIHISVHWI